MHITATPQLLLREMTPEDFPALHSIFSDEETMQYYPAPFDEKKTRGWDSLCAPNTATQRMPAPACIP